ncbi:YadA-like family protein [uncultured Dialister sp.]|jgi:hypothetical protein|uniref:YadA-like family protein n=1 Tax=uncultured Dialister sp. TaxID=278064 RepID=UPI00261DAC2D|nr:YadA-like family protein [uncultured Dialister sp.]
MNKIYKVMYSKVKQCAVVVSEIAKSHGQSGESGSMKRNIMTAMVLTLLAAGSFSFVNTAWAKDTANNPAYSAGWGIKITDENDPKTGDVTKKNIISLNPNLGKNYGNTYDGETYGGKGKVTFEADGENSLILGGGAINDSSYEADKDFTYGAHAKDSVLVGGMNNDIEKNSERALIVGGTNNKIFSTGEVQQTGTDAIIVGGSGNKAEGDNSLLIGGVQNEASGLKSTIIGGLENKNEGWDASIWGGYYNQITGVSQASGILGGDNNKILNGGFSYILGGENNTADGGLTVIIGGGYNKSSGLYSSVFGGLNNTATGRNSSIIGGTYNAATGSNDVVIGGFGNLTSSDHSYVAGGTQNYVTGMAASAIGGVYSSINGAFSTGVAGGSTGQDAMFSLAAGYQSVVADGGVEKTYLTGEAAIKVLDDMYSGKNLSGYYVRDPSVESGPDNPGRLIHYDKFSTALGYQATANQAGTISFGHDAGDDSGYTYEWETLTDDKGNPKQNLIDGTTNDYTKAPKSVKKKAPYTSAYYNRLVKVADGIDDHDVVVMEQLKQYAEKDASNIGNNLTVAPVYQKDGQDNIKLGTDSKPLVDEEATQKKLAEVQKANKDAWGKALGADPFTAGTATTVTNASTSDQLVTGKTLYNYDKPTGSQNYVKVNNTTGQNLSALDAQVKDNADAIQKNSESIQNITNNLNNNINKAAAGSNALAALHPLDYDPDDKADFAVGYGHYRNANAAAVGAFYHPNENTMVNVGVSLGNGDPGFNAGVSFKIGSGSAGHQAMSKTEMAKVINSQSKEIDALKKDNADKDKRIDALEQKMAEILAKLDKNGK